MTYREKITAILECSFAGFKEEIINSACNCILEQKPKTGHWIISPNDCFVHCSECGLHGDKGIYKRYRWCPNCGAEMVELQKGEV